MDFQNSEGMAGQLRALHSLALVPEIEKALLEGRVLESDSRGLTNSVLPMLNPELCVSCLRAQQYDNLRRMCGTLCDS